MNQRWKIAIPLGILLMPPLIWLFFKTLTTQHYNTLPVYGEKSVPPGGTDTVFHSLPVFKLYDQTGRAVTNADVKGKFVVANIFAGTDPDRATAILRGMSVVQGYWGTDHDVVFVSLSADPANDSTEVLREFAKPYSANPPNWYFLTGNKTEVFELAEKGFLFDCRRGALPFSLDETLRLVDPDGKIRGMEYNARDQKAMDLLIDDIKALKWEYKQVQN